MTGKTHFWIATLREALLTDLWLKKEEKIRKLQEKWREKQSIFLERKNAKEGKEKGRK